ncbi:MULTISPECIES: ABC transporter permease [unclassified Aurantimonas]|uniref:ABC transporter permease n=1 Tax=unclassified Aurantimonas TaxID=2638230 RepID=UPI002E181CB9|nr:MULTISPECIES: ABC transporter permease [unclassified Aurantimonas]MEC5293402.1 ABC transporter permease [Aurantimonas sp. C2-3-R2]MEC5414477.1 ABC transporter permease [Aurantimonas sp. C2-4-R8]
MKRSWQLGDGSELIFPAVLLLVFLFIGPLIWFFIQALTMEGDQSDLIERASAVITSEAVVTAITTTNRISLLVTILSLLIGYPVAYYLANRQGLRFSLVLFCIIVPYFTSVIVRTYSWMVLLGRTGLINQGLLSIGIIDAPLQLLYNEAAVLIGMVYVLLPYMVLTLFAAMKSIDPSLTRAAQGLGASGLYTFFRIYFPLSLHGVISGSLIVFILSVGFFITPALMGGPSDVMIAMLIERAVEITFDWSSAAIMSLLLLLVTLILYAVYYRVTDVRRMMGA